MKGLVTNTTHVQYEIPSSSGQKVMATVKVFVHAHTPTRTGTPTLRLKMKLMCKVLLQGIHMCNITHYLFLVQKFWQGLKYFISRVNFKVKVDRSQIMTNPLKSHKQYV